LRQGQQTQGDAGLGLLMPWLVPALGLMGSLRLLSVPQDLLCLSERLWLWGECPELCSTLCWALLWCQPNWAALLGWGWVSGDGESWRRAGLGWKVSGREKHQCRTCTAWVFRASTHPRGFVMQSQGS